MYAPQIAPGCDYIARLFVYLYAYLGNNRYMSETVTSRIPTKTNVGTSLNKKVYWWICLSHRRATHISVIHPWFVYYTYFVLFILTYMILICYIDFVLFCFIFLLESNLLIRFSFLLFIKRENNKLFDDLFSL